MASRQIYAHLIHTRKVLPWQDYQWQTETVTPPEDLGYHYHSVIVGGVTLCILSPEIQSWADWRWKSNERERMQWTVTLNALVER